MYDDRTVEVQSPYWPVKYHSGVSIMQLYSVVIEFEVKNIFIEYDALIGIICFITLA